MILIMIITIITIIITINTHPGALSTFHVLH